jgi:diguanylate cyclase (GGDEF)-like protein
MISATRLSNTLFTTPVIARQSAVMVRIHPHKEIGQPFELSDSPLVVGREGCEITLPDDAVSRRHARIEWIDGSHRLFDLGSTNGTYVNECRITQACLQVGDRLRFGHQIFKYLTSESVESQYHDVVYKIMTTDGLTQVYNKQYFLESLNREMENCQRSQDSLCVMLMDLDHFKSVNDTYGHLAGDAVLAEFARRAKSVLRGGEILARYGGEEFAILCTRATARDAIAAAERVRSAANSQPVTFDSQIIPITVSIGGSCYEGGTPLSAARLIEEADQWLYVAKQSGRDQVQFSSHSN